MAEIIITNPGTVIIGCLDPLANNYNPSATQPCFNNICCTYNVTDGDLNPSFGCKDPLAVNFNPNAINECVGCCQYLVTQSPNNGTPFLTGDIITVSPNLGVGFSDIKVVTCSGPYSITTNNEINGIEGAECCSKTNTVLGPAPQGYQYYWDGRICKIIPQCPSNTICVNCDNFDWWNDTYIANHESQSLSVVDSLLWQQIVDLVTNSGLTVSVNAINGEPVTEPCCNGFFKDNVCICPTTTIEETYTPKCISDLNQFLNLVNNTISGYTFFTTNFQTIGPSLGLTNQQINFITGVNSTNNVPYINDNTIDPNTNVSYSTEVRLILSNALNATGGFYVNFGDITNKPKLVNKGVCDQNGGFWDGANCMCKPVVDQCEIDITQVKVINAYDFFNNPIQTVVLASNETPLSEACCNRLILDYNLPWEWQSPYCLAVKRDDCLPVTFSLNDEIMEVPPCENDLEISMWVYFSKPEKPCQPIPDPPDTDIITIEGAACDITLTPNTGIIEVNPANLASSEIINNYVSAQRFVTADTVSPSSETGTASPEICCYNTANPIVAQISLTDPSLNTSLTQVKVYNSSTDYFNQWVKISATLPTSGLTLNFGVKLEIIQGLNCCCNYEFFIDDIKVNCATQESNLIINDIKCPGFNLTKVIDNKKSWVYNPGIASVGITEYDRIEREDGSFGTLNGEGTINRTFAPSLDASIPWRYTDYWNQSSVYEKHSKLVLNTKELDLTFDMCAKCPISGTTLVCPNGYTLSANTSICYKEDEQKLFQDGDNFIFMDGDNYIFQFQT